MPICVLDPETIRRLGCPVVITTPLAVVKELTENAIDANATSIDVLISPDTLDTVEVRDNGCGIRLDDLKLVGRAGHTSKLHSCDDIRKMGGKSLGFRGQALASIIALAKVTLTTRTSGVAVATRFHFGEEGAVASLERVSAPVGTSVKVVGLFSRLPVRQRTAAKDSSGTIAKVREMLQAHALSRPQIRFSLRVLSRPGLSWSYTPGKRPGTREAVLRMFGSEVVSQCFEIGFEGSPADKRTQESLPGKRLDVDAALFAIEALVPRPDADLTKLTAKGTFISVDSRPILRSGATARKLLSIFRTYINKLSNAEGSPRNHLRDVFMYVNIRCRPGCYDVNIEPAKGDVLFADEQLLLDTFEATLPHVRPAVEDRRHQSGTRERLEALLGPTSEITERPGHGAVCRIPLQQPTNFDDRVDAQEARGSVNPCSTTRTAQTPSEDHMPQLDYCRTALLQSSEELKSPSDVVDPRGGNDNLARRQHESQGQGYGRRCAGDMHGQTFERRHPWTMAKSGGAYKGNAHPARLPTPPPQSSIIPVRLRGQNRASSSEDERAMPGHPKDPTSHLGLPFGQQRPGATFERADNPYPSPTNSVPSQSRTVLRVRRVTIGGGGSRPAFASPMHSNLGYPRATGEPSSKRQCRMQETSSDSMNGRKIPGRPPWLMAKNRAGNVGYNSPNRAGFRGTTEGRVWFENPGPKGAVSNSAKMGPVWGRDTRPSEDRGERSLRAPVTKPMCLETCTGESKKLRRALAVNTHDLAKAVRRASCYDGYVKGRVFEAGLDWSLENAQVAEIEGKLKMLLSARGELAGEVNSIGLGLLDAFKRKGKLPCVVHG
ncbi:hypothetical protein VTK73DRAFT_10190 [Phialemonium thermophilum]|uniref:DNA mismatch repair protein S5 domain-containing protein n=1 Tax=Phialemonium thermophilum TaxID=223376 RepID=A0ABR3XI63_9PEZI